MELRYYVRVLRRRWVTIALCVLIAIAIAAAFTVRSTPQYSSEARLFVSTPQGDNSDAYQGSLFSQQRMTSYADLITGEEITGRVVDELNLDESPEELSERVTASVESESVILGVSVIDPNPERAQRITATLVETFADYVEELETRPGDKRSPIKATVVGSASLPDDPTTPRPVRNIGFAGVIGLLIGLGLAILRETLDTTVRTAADIEELVDVSLLGTIPYDKESAKSSNATLDEPNSAQSEALRVLRTNLQFIDVDRQSTTLVVTSPVPFEGKTTTAAKLAITLAEAGQTVALVEGDLRCPSLAQYLGLEPAVGLTTVLVGKATAAEAAQRWGGNELYVLTSGTTPPNPSELLQTQAMGSLLVRLREDFDVVIIDAPPLLPVTDASVIAAQVDAALLVVRHGKTSRDQVSTAVDRLVGVKAHIGGAVLNMTPTGRRKSYGYGYYGYGAARSPDDSQQPGRRAARTERAASPDGSDDVSTPTG